MLLQVFSYLPAIIGLVFLSGLVFLKNTTSNTNRSFAVLGISIATWLFFLFMTDVANDVERALFYVRSALLVSSIYPLAFLYFSYVFPINRKVRPLYIIAASLPFVILALFSYSDLMVSSVELTEFGARINEFGAFYILQTIFSLVYILSGIAILLLRKGQLDIRQKSQINAVVFGIFIALTVNLITGFILLWFDVSGAFTLFGGVSLFVFACFVAYSVIKHRMFDVRLVIVRSMTYVLALIALVAIYAILTFGLIDQFFPESRITNIQRLFYVLSAVIIAFTFQPLKRFFDRLTESLFYRDRYETEDILNRLGKVFVNKSNSFDLLYDSLDIIAGALKVKTGYLVVMNGDDIYKIAATNDAHKDLITRKQLSHFKRRLTIYDEAKQDGFEYSHLNELDAYVVLRLELQSNIVGYLILGQKQSGNMFTKQDVNLLEILSQELAVAIQNAKNFEEIQAFSEKLEKEVEQATAELKEKNRRLEELDQAKDDFISMASHQLRTPLTTIKGYLSMLLEGDAGKIPKNQREFIDMSFVSSQRMAHLISDLLNVSRISTGRLTFDSAEFDLVKVIREEVGQLEQQADARSVSLTFHEPEEESIIVDLDEGKMRQVIMNFTDNAVYYSPQGSVDVYIDKVDDKVEVKVKDDGIGVTEEDQKQLFTKFYRAENARHVRPDGTGLGLYMAKQVIEAQDGEIIFESEEGKGSTFGFRFDLNKDDAKSEDS